MSLPAFIVMVASMASCQVVSGRFSGALMAVSLTAGFVLSAIIPSVQFAAATGLKI
jgi:hypothetical protein